MAKAVISEVDVLRFFETESLDKATVLFNIVVDKMRARIHGDNVEPALVTAGRRRSRIGKVSGGQQESAPSVE